MTDIGSLGRMESRDGSPVASHIEWHQRVIDAHDAANGAAAAARAVLRLEREIDSSGLSSLERTGLRFTCASLVINAGAVLGDVDILARGRELASAAQRDAPTEHPLHFQCMYNVANAILEICDLRMPTDGTREEQLVGIRESRRVHRIELRDARRMLHEVGSSPFADSHTRSAAYCNLANCLDHSGRWAESYDFYLRALDADPSNGNAAGNLAQLLMNRVISGVGQTGHIAAVHDKYVKLAQSLRDGTVAFAGERIAARWDDLEETESLGHLSHGMDGPVDEYREWVAVHRLALSAAVEGLEVGS